jgi:hypothetical protein
MQSDKHPLVDYHQRNPQTPPPQLPPRNPLAARGPDSDRPDPRPAPTIASGQFRPSYSGRDYADHSHWEGADHTSSWRLGEDQTGRGIEVAPPMDGFDEDRDYPAALWWTAIWYAAPVLLYVLLALVISTSTMRSHALHAVISDAAEVIFALAISLGVAYGVRRTTLAWRAITIGFGSAVVGAGIATLLISAF